MPKFIALQDFKWAHQGVRIEEFRGDQVITTDDADLIEVATSNGWMREQLTKDKEGGTETITHSAPEAAAPAPAAEVEEKTEETAKPVPRTKKPPEDKAVKNAPENK